MRQPSFVQFVMEQLSPVRGATCRAMFGGYGLYQGTRFFGIVFRSRLYFKTDAAGAAAYRQRGMGPFRPSASQTLKSFYEVPADVIEDPDALAAWASRAIAAQQARKG